MSTLEPFFDPLDTDFNTDNYKTDKLEANFSNTHSRPISQEKVNEYMTDLPKAYFYNTGKTIEMTNYRENDCFDELSNNIKSLTNQRISDVQLYKILYVKKKGFWIKWCAIIDAYLLLSFKKFHLSLLVSVRKEDIYDEIEKYIINGKYDIAEELYNNNTQTDFFKRNRIYQNRCLRLYSNILILKYKDFSKADKTLNMCLSFFSSIKEEIEINATKVLLIETNIHYERTHEAKKYIIDCLAYYKGIHQANQVAKYYILLYSLKYKEGKYKDAKNCINKALNWIRKYKKIEGLRVAEEADTQIAYCYDKKCVLCTELGLYEEALSSYKRGIEIYRRLGNKKQIADLLLSYTRTEFLLGNLTQNKWAEPLIETDLIYGEIKDYEGLAKYSYRLIEIVVKIGIHKVDDQIISMYYNNSLKTENNQTIALALYRILDHFHQKSDEENCIIYLRKLIELFKKTQDVTIYFLWSQIVIKMEHSKGLYSESQIIELQLNKLKNDYKKSTNSLNQVEILSKIALTYGWAYKFQEAIETYTKIIKIYEKTDVIKDYVYEILTLVSIFYLHKDDKVLEYLKKAEKLVEGTDFGSLKIEIKKQLISYYLNKGEDYDLVRKQIEESINIASQYGLNDIHYLKTLNNKLQKLQVKLQIPDELFETIIQSLCSSIAKSPQKTQQFFISLWYSLNQETLFSYFEGKIGLNAFLYANNLNIATIYIKQLSWLFDYFLIVPQDVTPKKKLQYPVTFIRPSAGDSSEQHISSPDLLNYKTLDAKLDKTIKILTDSKDPKKITEENPFVSSMYPLTFENIQKNTANKILKSNYFVLEYGRQLNDDPLFSDIMISKEWKYIPIFINEERYSEKIYILAELKVFLPFNYTKLEGIIKCKDCFNELLCLESENYKSVLSKIKMESKQFSKSNSDGCHITIKILEYESGWTKKLWPAIYINI